MINNLIHYVHDMGWGQAVYDSAFPMIIVALLLYFPLYGRKYQIPVWKSLVIAVLMILLTGLLSGLLVLIENGFQDRGGGNILRVFAFLPLLGIVYAKLLRIPTGTMMDMMAPAISIWHIIGQSVCPFLGCCRGIPFEWGIWNPAYDSMVFPVQWAICLSVLLVLICILQYHRKHQYDGSGKSYPIMLILVGSSRFFLEFLKGGEKLFAGVSVLALHALFMVLVGAAWMFTLEEIRREKERKEENNRKNA